MHVPKEKGRKKLDTHSRLGYLVGYELGSNLYRIWDLEKKCIYRLRDVIFDEEYCHESPRKAQPENLTEGTAITVHNPET